MRNVCWIILALLPVASISAQETQWAYRVLGYSSQAGYNAHSAKQALGAPDKLPAYGDAGTTWAPGPEDQDGERYIKVGFRKPMPIRQVMVAETNQAGSVDRIFAYDRNRKEYLLYDAAKEPELEEPSAGRLLTVIFKQTRYPVYAIKVVLKDRPEWRDDQIDAIGVSQLEEPWQPAVQVTERFHYPGMVTPLDNAVNSPYSEVLPRLSPDGERLYFCRKNHPDNYGMHTNDDIWVAAKDGDGQWTGAQNIGWPLNDENHNYVCSISSDEDGADLLTLGNGYRLDRKPLAGVSQSFRSSEKWVEPLNLRIEGLSILNLNAEYFLSADRKTLILAMESWDTKGGKDLYVAHSEDLLHFGKPVSLGSNINTAGREMAPFLSADEQFLFFSSDGFPGYGDQDIFVAERLDETWTTWSQPENLGPQVNSPAWDSYFSYHEGSDLALLSSNRDHYANEDIYFIKMTPQQPEREIVNRDREHPLAAVGYSMADLPEAEALARQDAADRAAEITAAPDGVANPEMAFSDASTQYNSQRAASSDPNAAFTGAEEGAGVYPPGSANAWEPAVANGRAESGKRLNQSAQSESPAGNDQARIEPLLQANRSPVNQAQANRAKEAAASRAFAWESLPAQPIATPPASAWDDALPKRETVVFPDGSIQASLSSSNPENQNATAESGAGSVKTLSGSNGNALTESANSVILTPVSREENPGSSAQSLNGSGSPAASADNMSRVQAALANTMTTASSEAPVAVDPSKAPTISADRQETSASLPSRSRKRNRRAEKAAAVDLASLQGSSSLPENGQLKPSAEGQNPATEQASKQISSGTRNAGGGSRLAAGQQGLVDGAPAIMIGGVHDVVDGRAVHATLSLYSEATGRMDMRTDSLQPLYAVGIPKGTRFEAVLRAPGYFTERFTFDASDIQADGSIRHDFQLVPIREGQTISLENIYFDVNSASLQAKSHESLDRWASLLANHPGVVVQVQGHTNNRCSPRYCVELSQKRAKSVSQYLAAQGVGTDRLRFRGFGSESPVADNNHEEGRARNQRVELKILKAE